MYILQDSPFDGDTERAAARWPAIERLLMEMEVYCDMEMENKDRRRDAIVKLLEEYCEKVHTIREGCLIVPLTFKDEYQLSHFISALKHIAKNIQAIVVDQPLKAIQEIIADRKEIAGEDQKVLQHLMQDVVSRIGIQLSVPRQHILNFLKITGESKVEVTMMPKIGKQGPAASRGELINFAEPFKSYKLVYEELWKFQELLESEELVR